MPVSTQDTDILTASLGRPIVLAYGRHLIGGNVILLDQTEPARTTAFIALGEGEWDGVEALWVNGKQFDITSPENLQFHKGRIGELSSDGTLYPDGIGSLYPYDDNGDQKADSLTPPGIQGLTFSRTCYVSLNIPFDAFAPSADLSFLGIFRTRKVRIFNSSEVQTGYAYSENPAWQIADLLTTVRGLSDSRLDWASFAAAASYCDQTIDVQGNLVPRFVSSVAFTKETDFDGALAALLSTCRGYLIDTEGTVKLRIDQPRNPVFDFTMDNILEGGFSVDWLDTSATANRIAVTFRDAYNNLVSMTRTWNHEAHQARTGRINAARLDLGNLPQHQAGRIANYLLARSIDNNLYCRLQATQQSLDVMPGDVVRVRHDAAPWGSPAIPATDAQFESFEVIEATDNPDGTRSFTCQVYHAETYSDAADRAQAIEETTVRTRPATPPPPPQWMLSANLGGDLRLSFAIPQGADYRTGDLTLLADEELRRIETTVVDVFASDATHLHVASSAGFLLGDYIGAGSEVLQILGPGVKGAAPTSTLWEVSRGVKGTDQAAAAAGEGVYRLVEVPLHFALPPGYTLSHPTLTAADTAQHHAIRFRPGRLRILHASLIFSGLGGDSQAVERSFSAPGAFEPNVTGSLPGMRTSAGGLGTIQIEGPLATGDDLVLPLTLPNDVSLGVVYASAASSPTGQPIRFQLLRNGASFGPIAEIPVAFGGGASGSGTFFSGAQIGNVGGDSISISLIQAGSLDPGEDLTVFLTF